MSDNKNKRPGYHGPQRGQNGEERPGDNEEIGKKEPLKKIVLLDEHLEKIRNVEINKLTIKTQRDYRNRIGHFMEFLSTHYDGAAVRSLTEAELSSKLQFHHKNKQDLIYNEVSYDVFKAFLTTKQNKEDDKVMSHINVRKFRDAVKWGAAEAKQRLPLDFEFEVKGYLDSYKKITARARKDGKMEEKQADPISWALFTLILQWALDSGNVFLWTFTLLQWNCMARAINISPLGLHNFSTYEDSIKVDYDKTKMDQKGDKVRIKHLSANPFNPLVNVFLGLGVWICLEALGGRFDRTSLFFNEEGSNDEAASSRYCSQFANLCKRHTDEIRTYIRVDHCNVQGNRKGSASFAASGTTSPPSMAAIMNRGEWSVGSQILNIYLHLFALSLSRGNSLDFITQELVDGGDGRMSARAIIAQRILAMSLSNPVYTW